MLKKMTFIVFVPFALFVSNHGMFAVEASTDEGYGFKQKALLICAWPQKQRAPLQFSVNKKSIQATRNEEFEELEEDLEALIEEMKKLGKEAREKALKEILPRIKEEIERLREKLRRWRDKEDESEPIKVDALEI
jgi:ElaB/YqjD/DUF883 family membrane-anchored ribosome-binding protein